MSDLVEEFTHFLLGLLMRLRFWYVAVKQIHVVVAIDGRVKPGGLPEPRLPTGMLAGELQAEVVVESERTSARS